MDVIASLIPNLIIGFLLYYFSDQIAGFFERTGSVNLIRGLDNPWTYKVLAVLIGVVLPLYELVIAIIFMN